MTIQPTSAISCPECGHVRTETMPTDACQFLYECEGCHVLLKPLPGDCCVFCSFGDVPCPPRSGGERQQHRLGNPPLTRSLTPLDSTGNPVALAGIARRPIF